MVVVVAEVRICLDLESGISEYGQTPLHGASAGGHIKPIKLLLDWGAVIDAAAVSPNGRSPLHGESTGGHIDAINPLLARGASTEDIASNLHNP